MAIENTLASANKKVEGKTSKAFNHGNDKPGKLNGMMDSVSGIQKNVAGTIVGGGRIVAKAAGALGATGLAKALTGSSKTRYKRTNETQYFSRLQEFYGKFSARGSDNADFVDMIDPLVTFDCYFEFFPSVETEYIKQVYYLKKDDKLYKGKDVSSGFETKGDSILAKLLNLIKFKNMLT